MGVIEPLNDCRRAKLAALLRRTSIEIPSYDTAGVEILSKVLAPGADVFVNFIPGRSYQKTAAMAAVLKANGFHPVPHIAARAIPSAAVLEDFLARLRREAEVDEVLLIAGDIDKQAGPYSSAADLLQTGALTGHGITRVRLAGYPEGHPKIPDAVLQTALEEKLVLARAYGLKPAIVTQFCFEAAPVLSWLARLRRAGIYVPVSIGIAGPASIATLMRYAMKCGIGNSFRALRVQSDRMAHLMGDAGPDELVRDIAAASGPELGDIAGFHLFPFGGTLMSAHWLRAMMAV